MEALDLLWRSFHNIFSLLFKGAVTLENWDQETWKEEE